MTGSNDTSAALDDVMAEWNGARLMYPLYCALARECVIDVLPCPDIEEEINSIAALDAARKWFTEMDELIEVHQLRHFLQTTNLANRTVLEALLLHHLRKPIRNGSDRNKLDFLLVQFCSLSAPPSMSISDLDLPSVIEILAPVLGRFEPLVPEALKPVAQLTQRSEACRTLKELFTSRIIEQGRKLKDSCGEQYFSPISMAVFAQFGFRLRRTFFRLMHQDLNAILDGLRDLDARGVESLDCRKAQFSAYEPLTRLRMICQSWRVMFHAEYSAGQALCLLVDLRTVVDAALVTTACQDNSSEAARGALGNRAVAAAVGSNVSHPDPRAQVSLTASNRENMPDAGKQPATKKG
jgi:hypothetical protein